MYSQKKVKETSAQRNYDDDDEYDDDNDHNHDGYFSLITFCVFHHRYIIFSNKNMYIWIECDGD